MKTPDLKNRVALVTGASRGIGAEVAKTLAKQGAHVVLLARTIGALEEVDDFIRAEGGAATILPLDLQKHDELHKIGPSLYEKFGRLDIFVGNAAMLGTLCPAHQIEPKELDRVMSVNFLANARLLKTLDPLLRASDCGRVIFTLDSGRKKRGISHAYWGAYAASKEALKQLMKSYAAETQKTNIRVNGISPGWTQTKLFEAAFPGKHEFTTNKPEDLAQLYLRYAAPDIQKHGVIVRPKMRSSIFSTVSSSAK